ncbi:MAG: efflux RND transporter periplasmic adaptor subunit [Pseudohongiella sp.]|nr:efflux RND transporter periplasmic adaptor subunit [Pseudohongiella sp.]
MYSNIIFLKPVQLHLVAALIFALMLSACGGSTDGEVIPAVVDDGTLTDQRGPNNGRLLRSGNFVLELAIFETGVPPEYRAWATVAGQAVNPADIDLNVQLSRLGGIVDDINFEPVGTALRGDMVIYEPHSFRVSVTANHNNSTHRWSYDSFEGRTMIEPAVAQALGIETGIAGPAIIEETIPVYGRIVANSEGISDVMARFEGQIVSVAAVLGDRVEAGDVLATIESNQSLTSYELIAPISGTITAKSAKRGEQTAGRVLFTITDTSLVWADLSVFPAGLNRIDVGYPVRITMPLIDTTFAGNTGERNVIEGSIARILPDTAANQATTARVLLNNTDGFLRAGSWISAQIKIAEHEVPLAVKRVGLQTFRDFTVVYAQIGDEYEVRMLEMGRQSEEWVEILSGLEPGTRYVTENSYILKADVEKDGASHDH